MNFNKISQMAKCVNASKLYTTESIEINQNLGTKQVNVGTKLSYLMCKAYWLKHYLN